MGRKFMAVVVAMITSVGIIGISYMIATMIAPNTPNNSEYLSNQERDTYMQTFPFAAFVAVAVGYILASFAGGFISTKMGRRWSSGMTLALVVGLILTVGSLVISQFWPQPIEFRLGSLLIFIPISLLGYKLANKAI